MIDTTVNQYEIVSRNKKKIMSTNSNFLYNRVEEHAMKKIIDAEIIMEPFPHILIDGIIPDHIYQQMMEEIPLLENSWKVFFKSHLERGLRVREQINVCNEMDKEYSDRYFDLKSLQQSKRWQADILNRTSWKEYREMLAGKALQVALLQKFMPFLEKRIGDKDLASFPKGVTINRETGGFTISPHTDTETKLLFGIFYLAKDDKHPELSTNLYKHKTGRKSWISKPSWAKWKDFNLEKRIEYLPNRMCIILKNDNCWHSVDIDPEVKEKRYTSYYSIWNSENDRPQDKK